MKKKIFRVLLLLVLAVAVLGGVYAWRAAHPKVSRNEIVLYGNVDIRQVQLAFDGNQRINFLGVKEGDYVKKGQLVATMDTSLLRPLVQQDQALVAAQRQVVARLVAGSRPQEIARDRAELAAAVATAQNAQIHLARLRRLIKQEDITKQALDDAIAIARTDAAKVHAAAETLKLSILGPRQEDIRAAQATLRADEAQLSLAQRNLAESKLYAPCDAVVEDRILEVGDMASPGSPVFTLALMNPVWVRVYMPETDLGKIHEGMKAIVRTDSYHKNYVGWIGYISSAAEFTPKSIETPQLRTSLVYQMRVYVNNPDDQLRLGMPATVVIPLGTSKAGQSVMAPATQR